jgi:hypothetical protein
LGCLFVGAIVAAPFLALIYGITAGLFVMVCALGMTVYLAWDAMGRAPLAMRGRLKLIAVTNGVLTAVGLAVLVLRLM